MLVQHAGEWQVCYQARGRLDGKPVTAWVYGPDSIFFCVAGQETMRCELPEPGAVPFFDDQFVNTIEEVNGQGRRMQRLAGANNIIAAHAAWQVLLTHSTGNLIMRDGASLIRERYLWGERAGK